MAREDFCFTYYDGDAARDKAHMTRLERGAYDDIISAQRKRGHLTLEDIKKVLSKDFEECWPSMEWILKKDEAGKFFIEWVDRSVEKGREHSLKQKEKANKRWNKDKDIPRQSHGIDSAMPLEDGDGVEDELVNEFKGESVRGAQIVPAMGKQFKEKNPDYPLDPDDFPDLLEIAKKIGKWQGLAGSIILNQEKIKLRWGEMVEHIRNDPHLCKYSIPQINKQLKSINQSFSNKGHGKNGKPGFTEKTRDWVNTS